VAPGEEIDVAVWLRAKRPGEFTIERFDITYRQDERT
jgi:hypothetical protein